MTPTVRTLSTFALSVFIFAACSMEPTALQPRALPAANAPSQNLGLATAATLRHADGLLRTTPLLMPKTVSKIIGGDGGTLTIPEAGVVVVVPRGAVAGPTQITVTARAGSIVAYDFAPHGITFAKPLQFTQSLRGTNASLLTAPSLKLGYYSDANQLTNAGGDVSELIGGAADLVAWSFTSSIPHFSGYMVSCGRN